MLEGNENPESHSENAGPIQKILNGIAWVGQAASWLIIPILVLVLAGVTLAALKVGTILEWESDIFLFGSKLTLASLGDLQWHLFGAMLMLTLPAAAETDNHVRVDLLRQHMSGRGQRIVDTLGSIFLLLPFAGIMAWHGLEFARRSFRFGEGSDYDGLYDRFVVKAFVPLGFALLTVAAVALAVRALTQKSSRGVTKL